MLINSEEYRAMFEVEEKLWWYKILHEKVIAEINSFSKGNKQIKILDAGCGTGGFLLKLQSAGYQYFFVFDFNYFWVVFWLLGGFLFVFGFFGGVVLLGVGGKVGWGPGGGGTAVAVPVAGQIID